MDGESGASWECGWHGWVHGWMRGLYSDALSGDGARTQHRALGLERSSGVTDISGQNQRGLGGLRGRQGVPRDAQVSSLEAWEDPGIIRDEWFGREGDESFLDLGA